MKNVIFDLRKNPSSANDPGTYYSHISGKYYFQYDKNLYVKNQVA